MAEQDQLAGMDEEGLRRTLGELLASNKATQANLETLQQQFPIQPDNTADSIPNWEELEEGGLSPPNPEEGEPESFAEQLGVASFSDLLWIEVAANGAILRGGEGLTVEHPSTGIYKIFMQTKTQESFDYPGAIRTLTPSTAGLQSVSGNVNLITSGGGVKGWEIVLVENVAGSTKVNADFHFSAANLSAE
ncbi:MAG TPA: hypothetical protein VF245_12755 [Solirubrobacterales bacterium]